MTGTVESENKEGQEKLRSSFCSLTHNALSILVTSSPRLPLPPRILNIRKRPTEEPLTSFAGYHAVMDPGRLVAAHETLQGEN